MSRRARVYWLLVAVTAANYLAMVVWSGPKISAQAGGLMPFDVYLTGYSQAQAMAFLNALSDQGRAFYLGTQRVLDTSFPALFAAVMGIALYWLYAEKSKPMRLVLVGLPVAGLVFDYIENARVAVLLRAADPSAAQIAQASQITVLKFIFIGATLALVLVGVVGHWRSR